MTTNAFDDIRPYRDDEIPDAIARISQWELIPQILRFIYPKEKTEDTMARLRNVKTIKELQAEIAELGGLTNQRITHMLTDLVKAGKLTKEYVKKTPYYSIAA
jgi:hypothetical protein